MYEFLQYHVGEFMSRNGVVIGRHAPLEEARRLFARHDFNMIPVVEGPRLVGVLTKLDFLKAFSFGKDRLLPHYREILRQEVESVMTTDPFTVSSDTPLTRVLEKIVEPRYRPSRWWTTARWLESFLVRTSSRRCARPQPSRTSAEVRGGLDEVSQDSRSDRFFPSVRTRRRGGQRRSRARSAPSSCFCTWSSPP